MSDEITIIERPEQHTLSIHEVCGTMKMGKVMGPAYEEIMKSMEKQGIECGPSGMPFTRYNNVDWNEAGKRGPITFFKMMFLHKWDMDIGIPVPGPAREEGRQRNLKLAGGKFLRALHKGPYMKVGNTYKKIQAKAAVDNFTLGNYSIEFYLNDPREVKSADLETEVLVPIC